MYSWLQSLVLGLALKANTFIPGSSYTRELVSHDTLKWVETIRQKYDIPGISLGIVAAPNRTGHGWSTETHGFGHMDEHGRPIDGNVCYCRGDRLIIDVVRHSL